MTLIPVRFTISTLGVAEGDCAWVDDQDATIQSLLFAQLIVQQASCASPVPKPVGYYATQAELDAKTLASLADAAITSPADGDLVRFDSASGKWKNAGGGSLFTNAHDYGAKGDGTTDDTTAIQNALAALPVNGGVVFLPAGTYKTSGTLDLGLTKSLVGASVGGTVINYTGSGIAVNIGVSTQTTAPLPFTGRLTDLTIAGPGASTSGSVGVRVIKCLFPQIERVYARDVETGFKVDGSDLWVASGYLLHLRTSAVKFGLLLTANSGKQVNDMHVAGGYFYGGGGETGAYGVKVEASCDTNHFIGTAVEGFAGTSAKGFWVTAGASGGNFFVSTRSESCTTDFLCDTTATNITTVAHSGGTGGAAAVITDNGYANMHIGRTTVRKASRYIGFASTYTPDASESEIKEVDVLTGNITIANPTNAQMGQSLTFLFKQDATGGRVITWGSKYRPSWTPSTTAYLRNTITFLYNSNFDLWLQTSAATGLAG